VSPSRFFPSWLRWPDRTARFEREARLLASLNHPNVAALYGFESSEARLFLVMELAEGDTLAQRIARGTIRLTRRWRMHIRSPRRSRRRTKRV
jgi:serine/threonine protein kinase